MDESDSKYEVLCSLYHDIKSPASFASEQKLYQAAKTIFKKDITLKDIKAFLKTQKSHTRHGNIPHRYRKRMVIVSAPGKLLSSDLADMTNIKEHNEGYKYLAFFIDCYSRKLDVVPLKDKRGSTMAKVLDKHLEKSQYKYLHCWVDMGSEYYNEHVKKICKKHDLILYSVQNSQVKASIVERCIRTYKTKLYKMFTHYNSYNYIKHLADLIHAYNTSPHRGLIGLRPADVHLMQDTAELNLLTQKMIKQKYANYGTTINNCKRQLDSSVRQALPLGTTVRLLMKRAENIFSKSYEPIFTQEIFVIDKVIQRDGIITYGLKDLMNEPITGSVYHNEIKETVLPKHYEIEKIIETKNCEKTNKKLALVKFLGYPDKFNEYIPIDNVVEISGHTA